MRLPALDLAAGFDSVRQTWIRNRLFQSFADSPAGHIVQLAKLLAPMKPRLVVSDDAVTDCAVRPTQDEWADFVDACNVLRRGQAESA